MDFIKESKKIMQRCQKKEQTFHDKDMKGTEIKLPLH